jgi:GH15 family glucan-1,4-alpha-glucosidase
MTRTPIGDYALVSDCHSAALVSRAGSVDWLCLPRFDSPSVFARLLDDHAGHWSLAPAGPAQVRRRYLDHTMVLETTLQTPTGTAVLLDAMAVGRNQGGHQLGAGAPGALLRRVRCTTGTVELALEFAPRPEYGRVRPLLVAVDGGIAGRGGPGGGILSSPVPTTIQGSTARAGFSLRAGQAAGFAMQRRASWEPPAPVWTQAEIAACLDDTVAAWRTWSRLHQRYRGPWAQLVHHSGRVLQALTFAPTGAIVAAPTTSLPETVGGARNWDYRYTWARDASLTLEALWVAACPDEAHQFFAWLTGAVAAELREGADLQIMFGVGGELDLPERVLPHLAGWRDSRPVRVGNAAFQQRQLDVYGELLTAAYRLRGHLGTLDPATRGFLIEVADAAAVHWRHADQGIWEVRGPPRDFLYSKLMCWAALDRAIALAGVLGAQDRVAGWAATRDQIRATILEQGWSRQAGAFTQAFGSDDLDASALMLAIVGFLPASDPRMRLTIDAIAQRLTDRRGLVYRYLAPDGLTGREGSFLLCSFWLAQALALAGEPGRAREVFTRALAYANDVGLLAEQVDPATGELLGNFPQALSHTGLINAAWAIARAERYHPSGRAE